MYAIVTIAGQQFKVEKGKKVFVHRLAGDIGDEVNFSDVMLISNENNTSVGTPFVQDAVVVAQILSHDRGDKVLVFKKKRRKGYQKLNGHRQDFTQILIEDISLTGAPAKKTERKKAAPKAEEAAEPVATAEKKAAEKPAKKQAAKPAKTVEKPKKAAAPKKAVSKPAAKKAPAKSKEKSKEK